MAAGKKRVNPAKQREKRAKIAAAVGCVLFLAVAAYEVPSIMKMMNQKPPAAARRATSGSSSPGGSIALPDVAAASTGLSGDGALANTDVPPPSDGAQLVSFSVFQTKNPFAPQLKSVAAGAGAPTTAERPGADAPSKSTTTTTPPSLTPGATVVPSAGGAAASTPTATTAAPPPTVAISVNGKVSRVGAQGTFPTDAPVFRLVAYTSGSADIGIVGGSLASGDVALTLQVGHAVTLQNTTDDKTYNLELISTH
jgi:hypothetical protein